MGGPAVASGRASARAAVGWREFAAVTGGALIGTGLRLGADSLIPHADNEFPLSTLVVNVVGAFVLGLVVATVWTRPRMPNWAKAGVGAGLLGSFTTFSALILSLLVEATQGLWMLAASYLLLSLLLGFGAAALGIRLGRRAPIEPDLVDE